VSFRACELKRYGAQACISWMEGFMLLYRCVVASLRETFLVPDLVLFFERMDMIMKGLGKIKKALVENLMQQETLFGEEAKAA
jgi:hypothetical protein